MRIREYMPGDLEALRRLHAAQGFGYPWPDVDSPLFLAKLVLEDDGEDSNAERELADRNSLRDCSRDSAHHSPLDCQSGGGKNAQSRPGEIVPQTEACATTSPRVTMAVLLRLTAEAYLLHDPAAGTPRRRYQQFLALHDAARDAALARGLDDVQAFLPPRIARAFGRRLARLGWTRDPWPCFSRRV